MKKKFKMGRTLVIGDIHGGYEGLFQVMQRAEVNHSDNLIFLGDYVDGWSDSPKVIEYLLELQTSNNCIFLKGNHESLFLDYLQSGKKNLLWESHGGLSTLNSYANMSKNILKRHTDFLSNLKHYHIDEQNRLFVHAGFTNLRGVQAEFFKEYLLWDRTLWEMVVCMDSSMDTGSEMYPSRLKHYKEIYIGHTPVSNLGFSTPTNFANVWNIDTGAAYKGCVSILDVNTKEYWQSASLADLYPNETGRN